MLPLTEQVCELQVDDLHIPILDELEDFLDVSRGLHFCCWHSAPLG